MHTIHTPQRLPNFGVRIAALAPDPSCASARRPWDALRAQVIEAERLGFGSVQIAQHLLDPLGGSRAALDTWTAAAAFAALTSRIEIVAAVKPYLAHPVVLAKMALGVEHISHGRFGMRLLGAWNQAELRRAGLHFADLDQRAAYMREWTHAVDTLTRGERLTLRGRHFETDGCSLRPVDPFRARPALWAGGDADAMRALGAEFADTWILPGQSPASARAQIERMRSRPRPAGRPPLRFALSAFVISRDTEAQAQADHERLLAQAAAEAALAQRRVGAEHESLPRRWASAQRVGEDGGVAAGLIGSHAQVARRIDAYRRAGVDGFVLEFAAPEAEMRGFMHDVLPRLDLPAGRHALAA